MPLPRRVLICLCFKMRLREIKLVCTKKSMTGNGAPTAFQTFLGFRLELFDDMFYFQVTPLSGYSLLDVQW